MTKKLVTILVALSILGTAKVWAEDPAPKKVTPAKQPKVVETRLHESDMGKIETAINKAVKEAVIAKQGPSGWEYMAKSMKPPKNDKWQGKWNELGAEGWEAIDHFENYYIFKRPAMAGMKPKVDEKALKKEQKEKEKADKKAQEDAKKAQEDQEKAAKKAQKEQEKAEKKAKAEQEKAAKKAAKEAK